MIKMKYACPDKVVQQKSTPMAPCTNYLARMRSKLSIFTGLLLLIAACAGEEEPQITNLSMQSPDGQLELVFARTDSGQITYALQRAFPRDSSATPAPPSTSAAWILPSTLGFELADLGGVTTGLEITAVKEATGSEEYDLPWGETARVEAAYTAAVLTVHHPATGFTFDVESRLFNDGLGLRYTFYKSPNREPLQGDSLSILEELTQFRIQGDPLVNWGPGDWNSYENRLELTRLSAIDAKKYDNRQELIHRVVPNNAVMTPVTMRLDDGTHLSIHEAALIDYPEMTLERMGDGSLRSTLAGSKRRRAKVVRQLPFSTPWRTIAVERRAIDLLDNHLVLNLNPANELGDVSWFTPTTYAGVWWEMFLGKGTWDYASGQDAAGSAGRNISGKPRHAANTANVKRYIDFCADNNIGGLLVEGWNTGWEVWLDSAARATAFDFITPYPDYDLDEVVQYGKSRGVDIIIHHETSAVPQRYEQQLEPAFQLMRNLDLHVVKSGYVGNVLPKGEYHHGQYMVRHYRQVLQTAATYNVAINAHEPIKPTGERRTLPNAISAEGARGMEYNAFGDYKAVNQPAHLPSLVYTRCLAGPFDYTPGIFNLSMKPWKGANEEVLSTLGGQLGTYIVIYAPIQMVADLPEHYRLPDGRYHPAMPYLRQMATNWDATYPLAGELGDYAVVARKERGQDRYFIGGITGDQAQNVNLPLDFLPSGKTYRLDLYRDADDAHYRTNKTALTIETRNVSSTDSLKLMMKTAGGFGAILTYIAPAQ